MNPCGRQQKVLSDFFELLRRSPRGDGIFNPWWENDTEYDLDTSAPDTRRRNLRHYILERKDVARHLLLAEAMGYQGGHFTGIPMTSERILLGGLKERGLLPAHVVATIRPERTSRPDLKPRGFTEPTATIVWTEILRAGDPADFILWNAFPWHPYDPRRGPLSNRTPTVAEIREGAGILRARIDMARVETSATLGKKARRLTDEMGIGTCNLRHPASGGASRFRRQFFRYVNATR